jgi:hypothetical protein
MRNRYSRWTKEEDALIRRLYEDIVRAFPSRRASAIFKRATTMGLWPKRKINYRSLSELLSFANKVEKTGCLEWTRGQSGMGYGVCRVDNERWLAHRLSYSLANPSVDIGNLNINHKCDNRKCINPDHLYAGTQAENMRDMGLRGRRGYTGSPGGKHPMAKLTEPKVRNIKERLAHGETSFAIAKDYPEITPSLIRRIRRGAAWVHIK